VAQVGRYNVGGQRVDHHLRRRDQEDEEEEQDED
jgi:hypothetical protein